MTNAFAPVIPYIHHTCEFEQYCHVGNTAQQCRLGLFQDSDFAGDLEDSKSTSGGILCMFGSRTFVPRSWMCKKQTSVSHSSTEAVIVSLDAGLRMAGIPALDLRLLKCFILLRTNPTTKDVNIESSPIRCGGTRLDYSMDTITSVQNKIFSGIGKELTKVSSRQTSQESFILTIPWSLAKNVKIYPGIIEHQHLTVPKQMVLLKERCAE